MLLLLFLSSNLKGVSTPSTSSPSDHYTGYDGEELLGESETEIDNAIART